MLLAAALFGVVFGAVVSGGFSGGDTPAISGSPKDAVAVVESYSTALGRHDWPTICNRLYSAEARAAAGGSGCPARLAQAAGEVRQPELRILSVDVRGSQATVQVQASVNGGAALKNTIELVREGGSYRIVAAGGSGSD